MFALLSAMAAPILSSIRFSPNLVFSLLPAPHTNDHAQTEFQSWLPEILSFNNSSAGRMFGYKTVL